MPVSNNTASEIGRGDVLATPEGVKWLEDHDSFVEIISQFTHAEGQTELFFNNIEGVDLRGVGMGSNSQVYRVDELALKLSSPYSGRSAYNASRPYKPENLFNQFKFTGLLAERLEASHDIRVPRQYFALHSPAGNLRGEELIPPEWQTVGEFSVSRGYSKSQEQALNESIKARILGAVGRSMLLCMDFGQTLHNHNVLVPRDVDKPENGPLYIIDQPSNRAVGTLSLAVVNAQSRLKRHKYKL